MKIEADLPGVASVDVDLELGDSDDEQFGSSFHNTGMSTSASGSESANKSTSASRDTLIEDIKH